MAPQESSPQGADDWHGAKHPRRASVRRCSSCHAVKRGARPLGRRRLAWHQAFQTRQRPAMLGAMTSGVPAVACGIIGAMIGRKFSRCLEVKMEEKILAALKKEQAGMAMQLRENI